MQNCLVFRSSSVCLFQENAERFYDLWSAQTGLKGWIILETLTHPYCIHTQACSHAHTHSWQQSRGVCGNPQGSSSTLWRMCLCSVALPLFTHKALKFTGLQPHFPSSPLLQRDQGWLFVPCSFHPNLWESPKSQFSWLFKLEVLDHLIYPIRMYHN